MLNCKQVTHLLSEGQDRKLSAMERLRLKVHLAMCEGCTQYEKQLRFIRQACRGMLDNTRQDR